jgi:uncharacterized membrane protein
MNCDKCGRPAWKKHGGMGGGIMPDYEDNCLRRDDRLCRVAAHGYRAGWRDCTEAAKRTAFIMPSHHIRGQYVSTKIDWSDFDAELARRGK